MLLERISDGNFVTTNKLDFCYTNCEFSYELFENLNHQPTQKLKLKFKSEKLRVKSQKIKVDGQKLIVSQQLKDKS